MLVEDRGSTREIDVGYNACEGITNGRFPIVYRSETYGLYSRAEQRMAAQIAGFAGFALLVCCVLLWLHQVKTGRIARTAARS